MNLFDLMGKGTGRSFYMRDFKNGYRFRPDVNPPRQQFNGFVNFILNRNVYEFLYNAEGKGSKQELRTTMSSLVRTADLPSASFKTETLPQYNKKKIVNTGVEYEPVSITVLDTVGNEWLTILMKYFSYHFMNPRNKSSGAKGREFNKAGEVGGLDMMNSEFGSTNSFDSNAAGYNTNLTPYFFERIDYVLYHGNKGVQYSLINPVITGFKTSSIDYSSSNMMEFNLQFAYESFTIANKTNFDLGSEDFDRFENVSNLTGPQFVKDEKTPLRDTILKERTIDFLGAENNKVGRTGQSYTDVTKTIETYAPSQTKVYDYVNNEAKAFGEKKDESFGGSLLERIADRALTAAINGGNIKDPAIGAASESVIDQIASQKAGRYDVDE